MANEKSLGQMNPRPSKQMNPRPSMGAPKTLGGTPSQVKPYAPQPTTVKSYQSAPVKSVVSVQQGSSPSVVQDVPGGSLEKFVDLVKKMVGGFAYLNDDVIAQNLRYAAGEGMSTDDRTISFECADYIISNLAYIFMGVVLDKNFKQAFLDAVVIELELDSKSDEEKAKIRASMKDNKEYVSNGSVVLGVTSFTPPIEAELFNRMNIGFEKLSKYSGEFDAEVATFTPEMKTEYGFIFSNFMYLIRAFTHNDMFMSYVITVLERVKDITSKAQ